MLLMQSARIYEENLGEPDRAIEQLRALLVETPGRRRGADRPRLAADRRGATDGFRRGARRARRRDEGLRGARRAGLSCRPPRRDRARRRRSRHRSLRQSPGRAPAHTGAREALYAIARGDDYRLAAVAVLEPLERAAKRWDGVIELLELRLAAEDAVPARLDLLAEIARVEETERRDVQMAFAAWARALTEDATVDQPREALERLAAAHKDWARLADVYAERMDATFDAGLQRTLAMRLASLYENELADLNRAADYLRKAQSLPGDEEPVLSALERILGKLGEHDELGQVLARQAELADQPSAQADFLSALGTLRLGPLNDQEGALSAFRDAVERDPSTPPLTPRWFYCWIVPRPRKGRSTSSSRWPRAGATTRSWSRSTAAGSSCTTIATSARSGCGGSPRWPPISWGSPIGAGSPGRALKEEPAAGGALDDWSGSPAPPSFRRREPKRLKRRWRARIPTPRRSWPCGPRACTRRPANPQGRRAPLSAGPPSRCRERRCALGPGGALSRRGDAGRAGRGARRAVGGRARSSVPTVAAAGGGAAS